MCYNKYIKRKREVSKMFREQMLKQFEAMPERYEIEVNNEKEISVWDKEDKTSFTFRFKENGNLKEIW